MIGLYKSDFAVNQNLACHCGKIFWIQQPGIADTRLAATSHIWTVEPTRELKKYYTGYTYWN